MRGIEGRCEGITHSSEHRRARSRKAPCCDCDITDTVHATLPLADGSTDSPREERLLGVGGVGERGGGGVGGEGGDKVKEAQEWRDGGAEWRGGGLAVADREVVREIEVRETGGGLVAVALPWKLCGIEVLAHEQRNELHAEGEEIHGRDIRFVPAVRLGAAGEAGARALPDVQDRLDVVPQYVVRLFDAQLILGPGPAGLLGHEDQHECKRDEHEHS